MIKLESQTHASEVYNFLLSWLQAEINYKDFRLKQTEFILCKATTAQKSVKSSVFWDVTTCILVEVCHRSRPLYCPRHQVRYHGRSVLITEVVKSTETPVYFYQTTRNQISEQNTVCGNGNAPFRKVFAAVWYTGRLYSCLTDMGRSNAPSDALTALRRTPCVREVWVDARSWINDRSDNLFRNLSN
jgi:hypothetical protein